MCKIIISVLFLFFFLINVFAENELLDPGNNTQASNSSIETFRDQITLKTFFYSDGMIFGLDRDYCGGVYSDGSEIEYWENSDNAIGFFVAYKEFALKFSRNAGPADNEKNYGKTNSVGFNFSYYTRKIGVEFFYKKYEGFYLENSEDFNLNVGSPETVYPNLEIKTIGLNVTYIFNEQFSFDAALNQTERQCEWEFSFLIMLSANYYNISNDSSLVPESFNSEHGENIDYQGGSAKSIALSPGIGIIIPFYNFYITGCFFIGIGYVTRQDYFVSNNRNEYQPLIKSNLKFGIGYNGDRFLTGMTVIADDTTFKNNSGLYTSIMVIYIELFIGTRF